MFQMPKLMTKKTLKFDSLGRTVYTATSQEMLPCTSCIFLKPDIYCEALITTTPVYYKVDLFLKSYLQQHPA